MKFSNLQYLFLTTLIVILAGCQSSHKDYVPKSSSSIQGGPIETKSLPALSQQAPLPGMQQPTVKVAMILPLSGTHAKLGNAMLNAAQLSLFENAPDYMEIISEDSLGTPQGAASAAQKAIKDGAQVIVGPIFSAEAAAVANVAASYQVPVLSFSNNKDIAKPNLFVLGFMPDQQMSRLFETARNKGISKVAILAASDEAGRNLTEQATQVANSVGIELITTTPYAPGSHDMGPQSKTILQKRAQAVLIPEGGLPLRLIVSSLLSHGVDPHKIKFMGSGQWDSPDIFGDQNLVGGWFAASPTALRQNFNKKYNSNYGQPAPRLATLAYDSISMLSLLAKAKDPIIAFKGSSLIEPRGFEGIDGIFRLNGDGTVQRGLAVYEITESKSLAEVSPAPDSF